jgi:hypothetical protein
MAKFKSFTDDSVSFATNNIESFEKMIRENPASNEWLDDFFKEHKLQNTAYDFDIELKYDNDEPRKYDFDNAKLLYEAFESAGLGKAVICNNKFMPAFALQFGYKYYLSYLLNQNEKIKSLSGTLFFEGDVRRSMARNIVGRLYLLASLSIDDRLDDRFEYTKYVLGHAGLRRMVFYTFVDNEIARLAFIKAVIKYEKESNTTLPTKKVHRVLTHLSCLSNVSHVSIMDEDEVEEYLYEYIVKIAG